MAYLKSCSARRSRNWVSLARNSLFSLRCVYYGGLLSLSDHSLIPHTKVYHPVGPKYDMNQEEVAGTASIINQKGLSRKVRGASGYCYSACIHAGWIQNQPKCAHTDSMVHSISSTLSRRASSAFKSITSTFCNVRFVDVTRLPVY